MRILHFLLPFFLLVMLSSSTCSTRTVINFRKTVNLLENLRPPIVPSTGREILGFSLDEDATIHRSVSFGPVQSELPGAGYETPPCNDGRPRMVHFGHVLVRIVSLIGDTGGDDVSDDANCSCDTHIDVIAFQPMQIHYADGSVRRLTGPELHGKYVLCPNIPEGHHISGGRDFKGPVITTLAVTVRVADDNMSLLADVRYDVRQRS